MNWWTHPIAVFLGRRTFWWDAEDFTVFYAAGTLASRGDFDHLYAADVHAQIQLPLLVGHHEPLGFYNPPVFSLLFLPFSWLPFDLAFQAWTGLNLALVAVVCVLLWHITGRIDRAYRLAIILGFLTLYPLTFGLRLGQFSLLLTASWAAAFLFLRSGRDRAAGLALTPLFIKPELLIPITIFLAWKKRWAALRVLFPAAVLAAAMSVALVGPRGAWDYAGYIASASGDGSGNMYGWNGLLSSVFAPDDPGSMTAYGLPLAMITLGCAAYLWAGAVDTGGSMFPVQWLALTLGTILWDAHFYLQDLIILAPAVAAVIASATEWRAWLAGAGAMVGWVILGLGNVPSAIWGFNILAACMVGCIVLLVIWKAGARFMGRRVMTSDTAGRVYVLETEAA
ncbi:MAG TPA: glycosyltransferase family 87 protein [Dehalococcoidia bacterium]|nr:glycosyltransferase family 87 protein [Dehalococcoidia bacterium]